MKTDIRPNDLAEIRAHCTRARSKLSAHEFVLCLGRAQEKDPDASAQRLVILALNEIDEWRSQFFDGRFTLKTEELNEALKKSDEAAEAILLGNSSEFKELNAAIIKAETAKKTAERLSAELSNAWDEFLDLPRAKEKLDEVLANLGAERAALEEETLKSNFKHVYRTALIHPEAAYSNEGVAFIVQQLVTRSWRLEIIAELEKTTLADIEKLEERNKELSRKLGRTAHKL